MKHVADIYVRPPAPKAVLVTVRTPENGVLTRTVYNFRGQCWSLLDCSHRNLPISWMLLDSVGRKQSRILQHPHDEAHRAVKEGCCRSSRCEAVPKSKKLLKFTLDDGHESLHLLMVDPHIPAGAKLYGSPPNCRLSTAISKTDEKSNDIKSKCITSPSKALAFEEKWCTCFCNAINKGPAAMSAQPIKLLLKKHFSCQEGRHRPTLPA